MTLDARFVPAVRTGLDRLAAGDGPDLRGRPVALLCHPASVNAALLHARALISGPIGARLVSLLGPEHGLEAAAQDMETVAQGTGPKDHVPTYSLYGDSVASLSPSPAMLHDAQWLIIDLQDVGARYYTYVWTAVLAAEVALAGGRKVLLLDRPNPIGGLAQWVEGGAIEVGQESFVGLHDVAVRHGMTLGELARMAIVERGRAPHAGLELLACSGWRRGMLFPATGLPWVLPSPNMPTLETAAVFPGMVHVEGTMVSEGRGTTRPFELIGAPHVDPWALVESLAGEDLPGCRFRPCYFQPTFQKHAGASCGGVQIHVVDRARFRPVATYLALLVFARAQSVERFGLRTEPYEYVDPSEAEALDLLTGTTATREALLAGASWAEVVATVC